MRRCFSIHSHDRMPTPSQCSSIWSTPEAAGRWSYDGRLFFPDASSIVIDDFYYFLICCIYFYFHRDTLFKNRIETSAPPPQIHDYDLIEHPLSINKEIESSSDISSDANAYHARKKRFFFNFLSTSTITSYVLSGTTITKSVTLGIGGCQSCVSCLPAGISVC